MRILAVDDEKLMLDNLCMCIQEVAPSEELVSFKSSSEALQYVTKNTIDVAFLDIKIRGMDGLELGRQIKLLQPGVNIIFCTSYSDRIFEAVSDVRCNGYLLKPIHAEDIKKELDNLRAPAVMLKQDITKMEIRCFGNFQVFVNGRPLEFHSKKAKELFAF